MKRTGSVEIGYVLELLIEERQAIILPATRMRLYQDETSRISPEQFTYDPP